MGVRESFLVQSVPNYYNQRQLQIPCQVCTVSCALSQDYYVLIRMKVFLHGTPRF